MSEKQLEAMETLMLEEVRNGGGMFGERDEGKLKKTNEAMEKLKNDGLSVEVGPEEEIMGNRARVKIIEHNKDGTKRENYLDFIKINNKWKWKIK